MAKYPKYKVAAVQAAPVYLDLEATVEKSVKIIKEAADNGAKLIGFPEGFLPGYPWFAFLGRALDYVPRFYHQLYLNAVECPSSALAKISQAARDNDIFVCISASEKDGGSLYLTQFWFDNKGNLLGKHRKMRVSVAERLIWGDGQGSMMPVFETELGNLGGCQCWEHDVALDICAMNGQNEQVHVASWPGYFDDDIASRSYAIKTQTFVLMTSSVYDDRLYTMLCTDEEGNLEQDRLDYFKTLKQGHTAIIGPDGNLVSDYVPLGEEGIAYADIDLEDIILYKYQMDTAGHYSNQSLSLNFNRNPNPVVRMYGDGKQTTIPYEEMQPYFGE
ncbi:MAG: carbon-nitrogen hydrolase family protein [Clostridium sp.]|nr:carbon-nitrogen hydrolase family protein [Clostridium sp.]